MIYRLQSIYYNATKTLLKILAWTYSQFYKHAGTIFNDYKIPFIATTLSVQITLWPWSEAKSYQTRFWIHSFLTILRKFSISIFIYYHGVSNKFEKEPGFKMVVFWKLFWLIDKTPIFWPKREQSSTPNSNTIVKNWNNRLIIVRMDVHKYHFKLSHMSCYNLFGKFDKIKLLKNNYCIYKLMNISLCVRL